MGGYNAFRGWDRSTYFEFESDPSRSSEFVRPAAWWIIRSRLSIQAKYRNEPDQVILTFENVQIRYRRHLH